MYYVCLRSMVLICISISIRVLVIVRRRRRVISIRILRCYYVY